MKKSIAVYGNTYQDTILTVANFPVENIANTVLNSQFKQGGIHNVARALSVLNHTRPNQTIIWKQSAATILYNLSTSQRTSLVNSLSETNHPHVVSADWHHICYLDDLEIVSEQPLRQMKQTGKISIDFCKRSNKIRYLPLLKYADIIFCSTEDCLDSDELLSQLNPDTLLILHNQTGSRTFQANQLLLQHSITRIIENANPLGAGDAFAAAFIDSFIQGDGFSQAIAKAHDYATQNILRNNHE